MASYTADREVFVVKHFALLVVAVLLWRIDPLLSGDSVISDRVCATAR
jgi:hypothetical protein